MLTAIYQAAGYGPIMRWVDDFLVIRLPGQSWTETREAQGCKRISMRMVRTGQQFHSQAGGKPAWQAGFHFLHLPTDLPIPSFDYLFCTEFQVSKSKTTPEWSLASGPAVDSRYPSNQPQVSTTFHNVTHRHRLVGGRKHVIRHWRHNHRPLGDLEMGSRYQNRPEIRTRHWMGRGSGNRIGSQCSIAPAGSRCPLTIARLVPGAVGRQWGSSGSQQRSFTKQSNQCYTEKHLPISGPASHRTESRICPDTEQHSGCLIKGRFKSIHNRFPLSNRRGQDIPTQAPCRPLNTGIIAKPAFIIMYLDEELSHMQFEAQCLSCS
jgi:hypothetical protein